MDDLDIQVAVAKIHLSSKYDIHKNEHLKTVGYLPVDCIGKLTPFNPLTDDALCFQLMNKHNITLINHEGTNGACYAIWAHSNETPHPCSTQILTNQNMAICLAIIEAHRDNS